MKPMRQTGAPAKPSLGFSGRGEAREWASFPPLAKTKPSGLRFDDVRTV